MGLALTNKDLNDENALANKLVTLAEIIVRKHFYSSKEDKDDLVSIGVLKAISMIKSGRFDAKKGNLCTFLYTGMRNDMHNYLYHLNKLSTVNLDLLSNKEGIEDDYFNERYDSERNLIEYSLVHLVCMEFSNVFGDNIESEILDKLNNSGFNVIGMCEEKETAHTYCCCNDILKDKYDENVRDDVINRIVGIIIWKDKIEKELEDKEN